MWYVCFMCCDVSEVAELTLLCSLVPITVIVVSDSDL